MPITKYYNFAKLLSYNATINAVCGGRGLGKTFGGKDKGIRDALKTVKFTESTYEVERRGKTKTETVLQAEKVTNQFIYLRRYKDELSLARGTFFADIEYKFPEWDFRVRGYEAQASPRKYADMARGRPWATIGFFVALSVAQNFKSVQFPNVKLIIFDEFIIEKGGIYLPDEASKFLNFYNTVDRYKDKTRVFMLANSVAITNPYMIHYRVNPNDADKNGFIKLADPDKSSGPDIANFMIWHFPDSKEFQNEVFQTKFGKFIASTDPDYADYAVGNKFSDNNDNLVDSKPSSARYLFTLETKRGIFSIWYNISNNMYYCQEKRPRADEDFVTFVEEYMAEGKRLMTFQDKPLQMLRTAFRHDRVRFDRAPARNAFMEIFKR